MNLDRDAIDQLNDLLDEAVVRHGRDHIAAASTALDQLRRLEAGGIPWAGHVLDAAQLDGITKRIKGRARRSVVSVPSRTGKSARMPQSYSRRRADGSYQLELWMDMPLDQLATVIAGLDRQAGVLNQRGSRMRWGLELAEKHGVATARLGFEAEGVAIDESGAA